MTITSVQNPLIQETTKLADKKARAETGLILVEGPHPVEEALKADLQLENLFYLESATLDNLPQSIEPQLVSEGVMKKMTTTKSPPPVVATFKKPTVMTDDLFSTPNTLLLILDKLQDPGNTGTIIRTALAFGITGIITTEGTVDLWSPKVIRATAGAIFNLPIAAGVFSTDDIAKQCATHQITCFLTAVKKSGTIAYTDVDYTESCAIFLGSEGHGLEDGIISGDAKPMCQWITIPTSAKVDSLNVAVSSAILMAEAAKQRSK